VAASLRHGLDVGLRLRVVNGRLTGEVDPGISVEFSDAGQLEAKVRSLRTVLDQVDLTCAATIDVRRHGLARSRPSSTMSSFIVANRSPGFTDRPRSRMSRSAGDTRVVAGAGCTTPAITLSPISSNVLPSNGRTPYSAS
jgi:hypothetical protein